MTYPPTHLLNPAFRYVRSSETNIAVTFARIIAARKAKQTESVVTQLKCRGNHGS